MPIPRRASFGGVARIPADHRCRWPSIFKRYTAKKGRGGCSFRVPSRVIQRRRECLDPWPQEFHRTQGGSHVWSPYSISANFQHFLTCKMYVFGLRSIFRTWCMCVAGPESTQRRNWNMLWNLEIFFPSHSGISWVSWYLMVLLMVQKSQTTTWDVNKNKNNM